MNRNKIHTFIGLCLLFTVVSSGWFFTKGILNRKESEILKTKGRILIAEAIASAEEQFEQVSLSEELTAQILAVWNAGGRQVYHEPTEGQMTMEQAIEVGMDWIGRLTEAGILLKEVSEKEAPNISAVLYTLENKHELQKDLKRELLSCWTVIYTTTDVEVYLTIHAYSGQVWKADISMPYSAVMAIPCSDEQLIETAFPFLSGYNNDANESNINIGMGDSTEMKEENGVMYKIAEYRYVYAVCHRYTSIREGWQGKDHLQVRLCTVLQ